MGRRVLEPTGSVPVRFGDSVPFQEVAETKRALRAALRAERCALSVEERARIDARIAERVCALPVWRAADAVFAYCSFSAEVDTRALIVAALSEGGVVALPRCLPETRALVWYRVTGADPFAALEQHPHGMLEPRADPRLMVDPSAVARSVALVPGLAFDVQGYRLGYGGGYYDRFLEGFSGCAVGLCRAASLAGVENPVLPREPHDRPANLVVTEHAVIAARGQPSPRPCETRFRF